jgi:hypothetical protein
MNAPLPASTFTHFKITPVTPTIGALIDGLHLRDNLEDDDLGIFGKLRLLCMHRAHTH